jgi:D-psicose/D-tagatose/L-ribulose 3-epimerase
MRAAIQALKAAGYDGWFTVEAFGQSMPDIAAATKIWRKMFASEDEVVAEGIRAIRGGWVD